MQGLLLPGVVCEEERRGGVCFVVLFAASMSAGSRCRCRFELDFFSIFSF